VVAGDREQTWYHQTTAMGWEWIEQSEADALGKQHMVGASVVTSGGPEEWGCRGEHSSRRRWAL
jgi:hypothetical protein